jgi:hypothetical protein
MNRPSDGQANIDEHYFKMLSQGKALPMLDSFTTARPSRTERMAMGKARRQGVPRPTHAEYASRPRRADPVAVLQAQNTTRIPKLVPLRMVRMVASPFAFLRGSAAIMAADLSATPTTGFDVMACGDMHLANFGIFGSAERNLIFAINDFDEVHPGPWEWDLKRLATSAAVAATFIGGDREDAAEAARAVVRAYVVRMRRYAEMGFLEIWYDVIDEATVLNAAPPRLRPGAKAIMDKARARGHLRALDRLTEAVGGEHRIVEDIPLIVRESQLTDGTPIAQALDHMLGAYVSSLPDDRRRLLSRYRIEDVARKVVGVGSVGMSCWVILLQGVDGNDPLFLQVKEARASVLARHVTSKLSASNHGRRVVIGQRMIQGSPDIFLGWGPAELASGRGCFYVRQLADMKGGMRFVEGHPESRDGLPEYCGLCGWALALAHAKSGDPAMITGYCGRSDALPDAIAGFALAYLDQTERDHAALQTAIKTGRVIIE